jgi:endoglucanase
VATAGSIAWVVSGAPAASAGSITGTLYRSPSSAAISWINANPNDYRAAVIRDRITTQPTARWYTSPNAGTIAGSVSSYVGAANAAGQIPQLIAYALPNRDCGGASAGGATTIAAYNAWMQNFAKGLGSQTVIVLLEPDSLALQTCLNATALAERNSALAGAVKAIKAVNPNAKVYLDGGHSAWNAPAEAARRLTAAGVSSADGFYSNVSNFRLTANEITFGRSVLTALNDSRLHQVIDTSRNGAGPLGSEWCDPAGRRIGSAPTTNTGLDTVDAFLWAKPPGEADGCRAGAGTFVPDLAYEMAGGGTAAATTGPTTTRPTTTPPTTRPTTTPPTTRPTTTPPTTGPTPTKPTPGPTATTPPAGGAGCAVAYRVENQWSSGFTAMVTVTNRGSSVVDGWTLAFRFPGSQRLVSAWNGTATQTGAAVTVRNVGYNGRIAPGASVSFGFQGTVDGANAAGTGFTLNGAACA